MYLQNFKYFSVFGHLLNRISFFGLISQYYRQYKLGNYREWKLVLCVCVCERDSVSEVDRGEKLDGGREVKGEKGDQ